MKVNHETRLSSIDQKISEEIEKKFMPKSPNMFREFREKSCPIEQFYLSHPSEPWSLRLREIAKPEGIFYSAALKSRSASSEVLLRDEIETPIDESAYRLYARNPAFPRLHKLRAELYPGVTIDWVEGCDAPIIEAEGEEAMAAVKEHGDDLEDITERRSAQNETIAHLLFQAKHGEGALVPQENLNSYAMVQEIRRNLGESPIIVGLSGRSGSGKSTLASEIARLLGGHDISSLVLSTDDYNRGKSWLCQEFEVETWQNWDDPAVYDCETLAKELELLLAKAQPIRKRQFDFTSEEPIILDEAHPSAQVIILEGLFAHSPHFEKLKTLSYCLPTPLATSIGRRIYRDINSRGNASFGSAEDILRYQLEVVEPSYQKAVAS